MEGREEGRKDGRIGRGRLSLLHFSCDVASSPNLVSRPLAVSASPAAAANAAASVVVAAAAAGSKRSDSTTKTNPSLNTMGRELSRLSHGPTRHQILEVRRGEAWRDCERSG